MKNSVQYMMIFAILLAGGAGARWIMTAPKPAMVDPHGHGAHEEGEGGHQDHDKEGAGDHEGHDHGAGLVKLSDQQRETAKLGLEKAGPGVIRERLGLSGVIEPDQEKTVQISPRFPGVVRAVGKRLGDAVKKDEILIIIESDESLKTYDILAPLAGTVIDRKVVLGEHVERSDRLMLIADLSQVWVDFRVFPQDFTRLGIGQKVEIAGPPGSGPVEATISYISPIGVFDTQSMLARATVANAGRALRPGLFVTGRVLLSEQAAQVVVQESAIQTIEGKPVVFIEDGEAFRASAVEIGGRDGRFAEILFGVLPGDVYVAGNSYILKAELGKAEAAHAHSH